MSWDACADYKGELPWTRRRAPEYWEDRLRAHYGALGVEVSEVYLKVWWRSQVRPPANGVLHQLPALRREQNGVPAWK